MPALPHVWTDVEAAVVGEAAGAAIEHATTPVVVQVHVAAPLADWYCKLPPHMDEQSSRVHAVEHATTPVVVQVHVAAPLKDWYAMLPPHKVEQKSRVHDCPSAVPDISSTASTTSAL